MAIAFDVALGASTANSLSTINATLNIANSPNRFALLTLYTHPASGTAVSVTIGGQSFSLASTVVMSTTATARLYVCYNPSAGTQTAVAQIGTSASFAFVCSVFNGVHQTTGYTVQFAQSGSAAALTATISTSSNELVWVSHVQGGSNGDASQSAVGATQYNSTSTGGRRIEHSGYTPAGGTQTVAYAGVAGAFQIYHAGTLRPDTTTAAVAQPTITLPLTGAGQG